LTNLRDKVSCQLRISESAGKHGVAHEDIWHAMRNAIRLHQEDEFTMLVGPATDGSLLEIGILDADTDDPVVIHSMPLRPNHLP